MSEPTVVFSSLQFLAASDLHGALEPTEALLAAYEAEKALRPTRLLLLGDLLYHGPRNDLPSTYAPKEVISRLNRYREEIYCVRGNCDTEVDQMVLQFPILSDSLLLPFGDRLVFATHGHRFCDETVTGATMPPLQKGDILLSGHTHVPRMEQKNGFVFLNPGSVSIPKNGSTPGYLLLIPEERRILHKTLCGGLLSELRL